MANTKFEIWLDKVNKERKKYWDSNYDYKEYEPLSVSKGKKYMKIIDGSSVWGFVSMFEGVNKGSLVLKGDLLKPASWNSPARNSARGNVLEGGFPIQWTGPLYLR